MSYEEKARTNAKLLNDEMEKAAEWIRNNHVPKEVYNVFTRGVMKTVEKIQMWENESAKAKEARITLDKLGEELKK